MNRHDTSKSGLFLIELILSIFFFIIAMAVCLQLFVSVGTDDRENTKGDETQHDKNQKYGRQSDIHGKILLFIHNKFLRYLSNVPAEYIS